MKIGSRLALGFGFVIVLMLIVAGIGVWRMTDTRQGDALLQARQNIAMQVLQLAHQVDVNADQAQAIANITDRDGLYEFKQRLDASSKRIEVLFKQLDAQAFTPQGKALYDDVKSARKDYVQRRTKALQAAVNGDLVDSYAFFHTDMPQLLADYIGKVDKLSHFQTDTVSSLFAKSAHDSRTGLAMLAVAALLALLLSPWFAWRVARSITRPLVRSVDLAQAVARRDLSRDIEPRGKDEIAKLEQALHGMVGSLRQTVDKVRGGAGSIALAAGQISAGNLDLSARTEQQSSSLTETAASMEELTATVRQNAENAQQANTLADAAARTASHGGDIVRALVDTMGNINIKSRQIADIVGMIDSIAFQTNILALNAAVEAARAGEQGRGFAVVASEVRALAQRSAGSAREIKDLVEASVTVMTQGNDQAAQAGASMQDIVEGIRRVTDIMEEISAASREQTAGIEQINTAVAQMDDATHQNASLVDESAAAAASLQEQADALARLVGTFSLAAQDGAVEASQARAEPQPALLALGAPEPAVG